MKLIKPGELKEGTGISFPPVDPEHPVHPRAKITCSVLNRHLQATAGIQKISGPCQELPLEQRKALSLLTGIDALRRMKMGGVLLDRPEHFLTEERAKALLEYVKELEEIKGFQAVIITEEASKWQDWHSSESSRSWEASTTQGS